MAALTAPAPGKPATRAVAAPAAPTGPADRTDPALLRAFAILRRERTGADDLGGRTDGMPASDYHGHLVRRLPDTGPGPGGLPRLSEGFVAPGPRASLCILAIPPGFAGPGGLCVPRRAALRGELVYAVGAGDGHVEISGVVPDGVAEVIVTTDRARGVRVPVLANGYGVLVPGEPAEVRFRHGSRVRRLPF